MGWGGSNGRLSEKNRHAPSPHPSCKREPHLPEPFSPSTRSPAYLGNGAICMQDLLARWWTTHMGVNPRTGIEADVGEAEDERTG